MAGRAPAGKAAAAKRDDSDEEVEEEQEDDEDIITPDGIIDTRKLLNRMSKSVTALKTLGKIKESRKTHPIIEGQLQELKAPLVVSIELYPYQIKDDDLDMNNGGRNIQILDAINSSADLETGLKAVQTISLKKLSEIDNYASTYGRGLSKVRTELDDFHSAFLEQFSLQFLEEINNKYITKYNEKTMIEDKDINIYGANIDDIKLFKHIVEFVDFLAQKCSIIFTNDIFENYTLLDGYTWDGTQVNDDIGAGAAPSLSSLDSRIVDNAKRLMSTYTGTLSKSKRNVIYKPTGLPENTNVSVYFVLLDNSKPPEKENQKK